MNVFGQALEKAHEGTPRVKRWRSQVEGNPGEEKAQERIGRLACLN